MESFEETYRTMLDEELLSLASQTGELTPAAGRALRSELRRRGLEEKAARRQQESADESLSRKGGNPDQSKLTRVFWAQSEMEGRLVQDLLREDGIESVIRRQVSSVVFPGACEILVLESKADEAEQIIAEYQRTKTIPEDETEATGEESLDE